MDGCHRIAIAVQMMSPDLKRLGILMGPGSTHGRQTGVLIRANITGRLAQTVKTVEG